MSAAVQSRAAQHAEEWVQFVNYTQTAVGAVPGNAQLQDMAPQLIRISSAFKADQSAMPGNRFIIVERSIHRSVAIVSTWAAGRKQR